MNYQLAQINIARMREPLDAPLMWEFVHFLGPINELAEHQDGFVWRMKDEEGTSATSIETPFPDDMIIVNMSVWESLDALRHFVYQTAHSYFVRKGKQWFIRMDKPHMVLWWVPVGHEPSLEEAATKLEQLAAEGPGPEAFDWNKMYDSTGQLVKQ
ncbi:MAG: DUF3291 domain-containing protein [Bacteroidota bacterium]